MIKLGHGVPVSAFYNGESFSPVDKTLNSDGLATAIALKMPYDVIQHPEQRALWTSSTLGRTAHTASVNRKVQVKPLNTEEYAKNVGAFGHYAGDKIDPDDVFEDLDHLDTRGLMTVLIVNRQAAFYAIGSTLDQMAEQHPLLPVAIMHHLGKVSALSGISSPWSIFQHGEDISPFFQEAADEDEPSDEDRLVSEMHPSLKPYTTLAYADLEKKLKGFAIPQAFARPIKRLEVLWHVIISLERNDLAVMPYSNLPTLILTGVHTDVAAATSFHRQMIDDAGNDILEMGGDPYVRSLSIVPVRNLRAYLRAIKQAEICTEELANLLVEGGL